MATPKAASAPKAPKAPRAPKKAANTVQVSPGSAAAPKTPKTPEPVVFYPGFLDLGISGKEWNPPQSLPFPRGEIGGTPIWAQSKSSGFYQFIAKFAQGLTITVLYRPSTIDEDGVWICHVTLDPAELGKALGLPAYLVAEQDAEGNITGWKLDNKIASEQAALPVDPDSVPGTLKIMNEGVEHAWSAILQLLAKKKTGLQRYLNKNRWPGVQPTASQEKKEAKLREEQAKKEAEERSPFSHLYVGNDMLQCYFDAIVVHVEHEAKTLPFYGSPYGPLTTMRVYSGPQDIVKNVVNRVQENGAPGIKPEDVEKTLRKVLVESRNVRAALVLIDANKQASVELFSDYTTAFLNFKDNAKYLKGLPGSDAFQYIAPELPKQTATSSSLLALGSALAKTHL